MNMTTLKAKAKETKDQVVGFVRDHRKEIIFVGVSVGVTALLIISASLCSSSQPSDEENENVNDKDYDLQIAGGDYMAKCSECGKTFDVSEARDLYNDEFEELDYDEDFAGDMCADCAIAQTQSNMDLGKAIDMMNGDEDYDDDFVERHL